MYRSSRPHCALLIQFAWLFACPALPIAAASDNPPPPGDQLAAGQTEAYSQAGQGDPQAEGEAQPQKPPQSAVSAAQRSPRATMATFLSAYDEAVRGQIERYQDALICLDLSALAELPEDARAKQGRKLAKLLFEFINRHGVELELIPDDPEGDPTGAAYTHGDFKDQAGEDAIQIRRDDDGTWRFTRASLEFVENPPQAPTAEAGKPQVETTPTGDRVAGFSPRDSSRGLKPAAQDVPPDSAVPAEFRSAQATMRSFLEAMREGNADQAAKFLDLSEIALVIRGEQGEKLSLRLQQAIKWTKEIVLPTIPDDPHEGPHFVREKDDLGTIVLARQGDGDDRPGHWLFTKETVAGLDDLFDALGTLARAEAEAARAAGLVVEATGEEAAASLPLIERLVARIPESLKGTWFLLKHWQWLGILALALASWITHLLTTLLLRLLTWFWLRRQGVKVDETVQIVTFRPVGILAISGVWYWGLQWLSLRLDVLAILMYAVKFVACWAMVWTVYRAVDLLCDYFTSLAEKTETKMDDLLVPFARKVAKTVVTVVGIVFIYQQFAGETPLKLLAGLGLGGLALALAAQDTLKNLFGSLTVILDRPFKVGDWVVIGDIEGTVETVGFRSTRVRTFYNSQMVVPNSSLMSATIDNYGARRYRRIRIMLSVVYSTPPEKMDAFCEGVRELIRLHPYTRKDYYHVYFNKFASSSLDILLYCFLETPDWGTELRERHRLFVDILRLAEKLGVEFAFPTQTVWLERTRQDGQSGDGLTIAPGKDDPFTVGSDQAGNAFKEAYGDVPEHRGPVVIERTPRSRQSQPAEPKDNDRRGAATVRGDHGEGEG